MLKVVSIGGFGHSVFVFDDMMGMQEAWLVGLAPAFDGEDISFFANHPLCKDARQYSDYAKMIEEIRPNVAVISTRLDLITDVIIVAANAGCHIIAEKPLALSSEKLQEVYKTIKKNNVKLTAMLSMRSEPEFIAARKIYKNGIIGEAVIVNGRKSYKYGTRADWFGDKNKYSGTISWVGIHAFDFINFVTGLKFTKVAAMKSNFSHPERKACEDNCVIVSELSNGGHGTVSVDLFRPENAATWGDDWVRVVGTKGIIEARCADNTCKVLVESREPTLIDLPAKHKIFKDFLLSLEEGHAETFETESFMLTEVCLRATQSAELGKFVKIDNNLFI
jgi:predicted dehydrogenase